MMWLGFHDAIREDDGERIIRYWKYLMVVFRKDHHYNYANEGLKLILSTKYVLNLKRKQRTKSTSHFILVLHLMLISAK